MAKTIFYKCEALLDQGHYIGEAPMGSACCNDAEYIYGGVAVCRRCADLIRAGSDRVSFPLPLEPLTIRIDRWKKYVRHIFDYEIGKSKEAQERLDKRDRNCYSPSCTK